MLKKLTVISASFLIVSCGGEVSSDQRAPLAKSEPSDILPEKTETAGFNLNIYEAKKAFVERVISEVEVMSELNEISDFSEITGDLETVFSKYKRVVGSWPDSPTNFFVDGGQIYVDGELFMGDGVYSNAPVFSYFFHLALGDTTIMHFENYVSRSVENTRPFLEKYLDYYLESCTEDYTQPKCSLANAETLNF